MTLCSDFAVRLEQTGEAPVAFKNRDYDPDEDGIESLLHDLCVFLEEHALVTFEVSGFGQERWPVDVSTDLAVMLEQLPEFLVALADPNRAASLDFYEQGLERYLEFRHRGGELEIECRSRLSWQPDPPIVHQSYEDSVAMLRGVRDSFLRVLANVAPNLLTHPWMMGWSSRPE